MPNKVKPLQYPQVKRGLWFIIIGVLIDIVGIVLYTISVWGGKQTTDFGNVFYVLSSITFAVSVAFDIVGFIICCLDGAPGFRGAIAVLGIRLFIEFFMFLFCWWIPGQLYMWIYFTRPFWLFLMTVFFIIGCREVVDSDKVKRFAQFTLFALLVITIAELVILIVRNCLGPENGFWDVANLICGISEVVFGALYLILVLRTYKHVS